MSSMATSALLNTATFTISGVAGPLSTVLTIPTPAPNHAAEQSILSPPHTSPTIWNAADPLMLWIIQTGIIIIMSRILSFFLHKIRQPRVVGDIITGLLLGPSVMGRIPHFTSNIFPPQSIPGLNLTANIGLVLFLFTIGVETDLRVFKENYKGATLISVMGIALPFGAGSAVAVGIYNNYIDSSVVSFGHFLLFVGTAMAITAFPVLARILTELRLLNDDVGVIALAAGVGNDIVGWLLLALAVALVNASTGAVAVYILLCGAGLALFLAFIIRPPLLWYIRRTGGFEHGPSQSAMAVILVLIFASAFITDLIGIQAILGGFMVGLIMPHDKRFATGLIEKIEDLVTALLLPQYFALSGLKTNLGLLNNGSIWGYTFLVIFVAFLSKFLGCFGAAKAFKFTMRESLAVGSLMSCKGLVELIVLNVGLSAGILNNSVFAMFVVMALVTTFATTPLVMWFYPLSYRLAREVERRKAQLSEAISDDTSIRSRFAVVIDRLDHLPSTMAFMKLLQPLPSWAEPAIADDKAVAPASVPEVAAPVVESAKVAVDALRLVELTERFTTVMRASERQIEARYDPVLNILRTFAGLNSIKLDTELAIVNQDEFAHAVVEHAAARNSQMLMLPWAGATASHESNILTTEASGPFDSFLGRAAPALEQSPQYAAFVRSVFLDAPCDVGLFLDRSAEAGSAAMTAGRQHVFLAFHGGPDDRAALHFVVQLCRHPGIKATIVRIARDDSTRDGDEEGSLSKESTGDHELTHFTVSGHGLGGGASGIDTVYAAHSTHTQMQSETADNLAISGYWPTGQEKAPDLPEDTRKALERVTFTTVRTWRPLHTTMGQAHEAARKCSPAPLLVVAGRARRAAASHALELSHILRDIAQVGGGQHVLGLAASSEVRKTLGDIGSAMVAKGSGVAGSLLVIQAGLPGASSRDKSA